MTLPPNTDWNVVSEEPKAFVNPFVDSLVNYTNLFKDLISRKGKMKTYYLSLHKDNLHGHVIDYKLRYNNAFVGKDFEWVGEDIVADIDNYEITILFPADKPFRS